MQNLSKDDVQTLKWLTSRTSTIPSNSLTIGCTNSIQRCVGTEKVKF